MARMPGAVWRPIPVASTRAKRRKGRGVCYHVAVSEAASLYGYFSTASADSHFYVAKDGTIEQYVDTDLVAYANAGGNGTLLSVETQGGANGTETEPWTEAQLSSLARIAKWAHDTEGVPLRLMQNSRPTERGLGWHKLGCKPWVVSGGEVWSSAYGKVCPGAAKIRQMPEVLRRAQGPTTASKPTPKPQEGALMALSNAEQDELLAKVRKIHDGLFEPAPRNPKVLRDGDTVTAPNRLRKIDYMDDSRLDSRPADADPDPAA